MNFGEFVDNEGVSTYLNRMYADIDVYENNIAILSNQFLSPIADMAPTFYRFHIRDTVEQDGIKPFHAFTNNSNGCTDKYYCHQTFDRCKKAL